MFSREVQHVLQLGHRTNHGTHNGATLVQNGRRAKAIGLTAETNLNERAVVAQQLQVFIDIDGNRHRIQDQVEVEAVCVHLCLVA